MLGYPLPCVCFFSLLLFCCSGSIWQFCLLAALKAILVASWHLTILEIKEGGLGWENEGNFKEGEEKGICAQIFLSSFPVASFSVSLESMVGSGNPWLLSV